jgi:hypothetical protein
LKSNFLVALAALPLAAAANAGNVQANNAEAQQAAETSSNQQAELAEAHAIIEIMFPPATRQKMFDDMLSSLMAQMRQGLLADSPTDPGVNAILSKFLDKSIDAQKQLLQRHTPAIMAAMAVAYINEFSLAELTDVHAFAMTPSGRRYLTRSLAMVSDPAVAKVNAVMIADSQKLAVAMRDELKAEIAAYREAHPEADTKPEAEAKVN